MILYLYKLGTNTPALTIKNARSYTADSVTDEDGAVYRPLAEGYELSGKADCSETLRADYRAAHPTQETRLEELEELVAALKRTVKPGDVLLFKASRGIHLEQVLDEFLGEEK